LSQVSEKHPSEFVGTWKSEGSEDDGLWFIKYFPNGKEIVVGLYHDTIFAYEAEWWVSGNFIYERISKSLYNDIHIPIIGKISKDKIIDLDLRKHVLMEESETEPTVYIRTSGDVFIDKYQEIDFKLMDIQANLPKYDDDEWIWLSVVRDIDTITYIYRENIPTVSKTRPVNNKEFLIETIRKQPDLMVHRMKFKIVYLYSDDKVATINILPDEYALD
jgi:hypothetical protein